MEIICAYCNNKSEKSSSSVNLAKRINAPIYCSRKCSGLGRRDTRTKKEKVEAKRLYDQKYRLNNFSIIKSKKQAHAKTESGRQMQKRNRDKMKNFHLEYCRTPEYRKWKAEYDKKHLANKQYGEFAEAALTLRSLETEITSRITKTEIYANNGTLNKKQSRRREYERLISNKS